MVLEDKGQVTKAADYLTNWLATVAMLVDKSMLAVAALYNAILCGERGSPGKPSCLILPAGLPIESHLPN